MTYIISCRTKKSILMASDTRLNYYVEKEINGEKYQEIICFADCIQKTFLIKNAKLGISFLGIGYFKDPKDGKEYPLSHFIKEINELSFVKNFKENAFMIFDYLSKISSNGDTGQYVKGSMCGFSNKNKDKSFHCFFNTFNNVFEVKEFNIGNFVDSENNKEQIPKDMQGAIEEIKSRIKQKSDEKFWEIGPHVTFLELSFSNIQFLEQHYNFNGNKDELLNLFQNDIIKLNGKILDNPKIQKINL